MTTKNPGYYRKLIENIESGNMHSMGHVTEAGPAVAHAESFKKVSATEYTLMLHVEVSVDYKGDYGDDSEFTSINVYDDAGNQITGPVAQAVANAFEEQFSPSEIGAEMRS
jgi:hypothetical protein